jgi:hypoxanthine phosphoribosyltransferase
MPTASKGSPRFRIVISEKRIRRSVERLARQIERHCRAKRISELTVLCVMDGAFIFCADLVRGLKTPTTIAFVKASSYNGTQRRSANLAPLPTAIRGRAVLVVDTIFDTGKTIAKVLRHVRKQTSQIALAILVAKQGKADLAAYSKGMKTFVGIYLEGDPFLVGYGLDCGGQFRHLKAIRLFIADRKRRGVVP